MRVSVRELLAGTRIILQGLVLPMEGAHRPESSTRRSRDSGTGLSLNLLLLLLGLTAFWMALTLTILDLITAVLSLPETATSGW